MSLRVLVTGGRDYDDFDYVCGTLTALHHARGVALIIEGGATGADRLARRWATSHAVPCLTFKANWTRDGKAASPIRNQYMLDEGCPDITVAFPGGVGTNDMVRRTKIARVEVLDLRESP